MRTDQATTLSAGVRDDARVQRRTPRHSGTCTCAHCGLPVPAAMLQPDTSQQFCCHGCEAVFAVLHECGLDSYYRLRRELDPTPGRPVAEPDDGSASRFALFDSDAFTRRYVQEDSPHHAQVDLCLENVRCAACLWLIERLPRLRPGVIEARLSLRRSVVRLTWNPQRVALSEIARTLERIGYPAHPAQSGHAEHAQARLDTERRHWVRIGLAGACAGNTMLLAFALYAGVFEGMAPGFVALFRWLSAVIGLIALAGPGAGFFRGAWAALRTRTPNLDLPIALALGIGGLAGLVNTVTGRGELYFDSLSVLIFLLLVGRYVQHRQQRWADETVDLLLSLTPSSCRRVNTTGGTDEVPIEALKPGDVVEVRSGELLPADGLVIGGASAVEQALLTGEPAAVAVKTGDDVFAGTRNTGATLRVRATQTADRTRVGALMRLVQEGVEHKPPIVQLTDRIAGWFVVAVSFVALTVLAAWWVLGGELGTAVNHTVALLIVACPCALALATPLTLAVATGRAAKRDILIKRAAALELLAQGGRLWFDKTGTLTRGRTRLITWIGPAWLRGVVAELERESVHPIGRALADQLAYARVDDGDRPLIRDRAEHGDGGVAATVGGQELLVGSPGFLRRHGVTFDAAWQTQISEHEAAGHTAVVIVLDRQALALAVLGDEVRPDAPRVIRACREYDWHPALLSGDASGVVHHVAQTVGIDKDGVSAEVSPEAKLQAIRDTPGPTVMIGDGVNDAAALAAADLGIAVNGGAEAALAAADVCLAGDGLAALPELLTLAYRTMRRIRLNLTLSLAYNLTAVSLAAAGLVNPLVAAVLMPVSSGVALAVAVGGRSPWRHTPKDSGGESCR